MYSIAGANLFGQWFSEDCTFNEFRNIAEEIKNITEFDADRVQIVGIKWSYNILKIEDAFYVCGTWKGKDKQFIKVTLPEECTSELFSNYKLVGSDYNLILVDVKNHVIWMINLEIENDVKKINFNIETPLETSKKPRRDDEIKHVVATNNSCLYLTMDGLVYSGLLPSILDTSHCLGTVIDVQCGYEHFVLLTDAGRVYTWGNGRRLQLGHGDIYNLDEPTEVEALAGIKIVKVRAGGWHSFALSEFGDLYSWGWNDHGQLGIKISSNRYSQGVLKKEGIKSYHVPTLVDFYNDNDQIVELNVKDIACGSRHSAVLLENNEIWTTGFNKYGQLGFPVDIHPTVKYFKKAFVCEDVVEIVCGPWCTVLIKGNKSGSAL